jgi:hypothetical protein
MANLREYRWVIVACIAVFAVGAIIAYTASAVPVETGTIVDFNVISGGSDYTTPHVVISGGGGSSCFSRCCLSGHID